MNSMILLHGALGAASDLEPLRLELQKTGITALSFSFSGHGKTPISSRFCIEQFADELEEFLVSGQLENPDVFGYSMGGYAALYLACKQPELLGSIITLGTKFKWTKEGVEKEIRMLDPERMKEKVPAFAKTLEEKHGPAWVELLTGTVEMMKELPLKNLLHEQVFTVMKNRVLVGIGDMDQMVTLEETMKVHKALPQGGMYVLPTTKHPLESADAQLLAQIIRSFVRRTD